jgi:penicillin amidase
MRAMQNDILSPYAVRVVASLGKLTFSDPRAVRAAAILARWDARAETTGPSRLFYAFMKEARKAAGGGALRVTWSMLDRMIEGEGAQEFWDDPATSQVETRKQRLESALALSLATVEREGGVSAEHWSWGKAHRLTYQHPFASVMPPALARRLVFGPVALPGEWHTLDVAGFPLRGDRYDVSDIPSARLIVDLGSPDDSRLVLPLGQSGQLFDRHGHDQLQAWASGRDFALPFSAKAVDAATISTLRFVAAD